MLKKDIQIGSTYRAKVSNKLTDVKIIGESGYGGWEAVNTSTGRTVRIRSAAKLRALVTDTNTTSNGNSQPNGNGDSVKLVSSRQQWLIEKLFDERFVTGNTVIAYTAAVNNNQLSRKAASDFIKKLLALPLKVEEVKQDDEATDEQLVVADVTIDPELAKTVETAITFLSDHMGHVKGKKVEQLDGVILRLFDFLETGK